MMTVILITAALAISTFIGAASVRKIGNESADEMLMSLCRTGEKNLDSYFDSVEQSVEMVSSFIYNDLEVSGKLSEEKLRDHVDRTRDIFMQMADQTHGVFTYYYRIDPPVSRNVKGFWYVNQDGKGFIEHEPTDISQYDTNDTSHLVWFTVPKATHDAIWLPPYITDNLNKRVISYNVPIYWDNDFIGVVGIEIDYSTMASEVDNIKLFENGYAFINDDEGNIIYHPEIDVLTMDEDKIPKVPPGLLNDRSVVRYEFEGVEKEGVWLPLRNGMRLNVTVPVSEINAGWFNLIRQMIIVSLILIVITVLLTLNFTGRITRPLKDLTVAAEQIDEGNYEVELSYEGSDEIGRLTRTVKNMVGHLKVYIDDLNDLAYADALTSVHNKGAFDKYLHDLQLRVDDPEDKVEFAVAIFDCDDLKHINDIYGHDKGDIYLKASCAQICHVFMHSPVFRTGGDEFAVILQKDDYANREELMGIFEKTCAESMLTENEEWDRVKVSAGIAVYDPEEDTYVDDVVNRADRRMYDDKIARKAGRI